MDEGTALTRLQMLLAQHLRLYLNASQVSNGAAVAEHTRTICSILARLLGEHLKLDSEWQRGRWIDDLTSESIIIVAPLQIEVRGLMIWGEHRVTQQWVEPFFATVAVLDDDRTLKYTLAFAIAADGMGRWQYGKRAKVAPPNTPDEWLFKFQWGSGTA